LLGQLERRSSDQKYISAGNIAMTDGKYDDAVKMFQLAVGLNQRDPALWVAYGDAMNKLSSTDVEFAKVMQSEDTKEGLEAFIEKRAPAWKGR